ncbi:hypothetical protein Gotur_030449 [Gossypium turneri]
MELYRKVNCPTCQEPYEINDANKYRVMRYIGKKMIETEEKLYSPDG